MLFERRTNLARTCAIAIFFAVAASGPALATDEQNLSRGVSAEGAPLALRGYDPVAYFSDGVATRGSATRPHVHQGATYYFASDANRKQFQKDPAKYAPAFGGYCAFGVSVGKKFDGDPEFWTVSGDRLYLNLNAEISEKFKKDVSGAVRKAENQWTKIEHTAVDEL